jgi:hypothetical protein
MASEYTSADARIINIQPGYGQQLAWITVEFYEDDSGNLKTKEFPVHNVKVERYSVGDIILLTRLRIVGWQIDPSMNLGK